MPKSLYNWPKTPIFRLKSPDESQGKNKNKKKLIYTHGSELVVHWR